MEEVLSERVLSRIRLYYVSMSSVHYTLQLPRFTRVASCSGLTVTQTHCPSIPNHSRVPGVAAADYINTINSFHYPWTGCILVKPPLIPTTLALVVCHVSVFKLGRIIALFPDTSKWRSQSL